MLAFVVELHASDLDAPLAGLRVDRLDEAQVCLTSFALHLAPGIACPTAGDGMEPHPIHVLVVANLLVELIVSGEDLIDMEAAERNGGQTLPLEVHTPGALARHC